MTTYGLIALYDKSGHVVDTFSGSIVTSLQVEEDGSTTLTLDNADWSYILEEEDVRNARMKDGCLVMEDGKGDMFSLAFYKLVKMGA